MKKRSIVFVLALVLLMSLTLMTSAFAVEGDVDKSGTMLGTEDVTWSYVENGDGTYTLFVDSETTGAVIPEYNTTSVDGVKDPLNFTLVQHYLDRKDYTITKVVFSEKIKKIGQFAVCNMPDIADVYILSPDAVCSAQAIYAYNTPLLNGLTIHAYTTATVKYAFNGETEPNKTVVTASYLETENFVKSYGALGDVLIKDADSYLDSINAAVEALENMPSKAKEQLDTALTDHITALVDATKHGKMPDTYNDTTTATYRYSPNGDGTYTVYISDEGGDGIIPTYGVNKATADDFNTYTMVPYNDSKGTGVTRIVFEDSITHIGTYTVANMKDLTDIYIMGKNVTMDKNGFYGHGTFGARSKELTIHHYSGVTVQNGISSSQVTTTYSYLEGEDFIEKYSALWTMEWNAAKANQTTIEDAVAEYNAFGSAIKAQLVEQNSILIDLQYALKGGLMYSEDTVSFRYEKNDDGENTYTVILEDMLDGDGRLPDYQSGSTEPKFSLIEFNYYKDYNITRAIVEPSVKYVGKYVFAQVPNLNSIEFKAPDVSMNKDAIYVYDGAYDGKPSFSDSLVISGYSTGDLKHGIRETDITVTWRFYDVEAFKTDYADVLALDVEDAIENANDIRAAKAALDEINLDNENAAAQLETEIAKINELTAALGVLGGECGDGLAYDVTVNSDTDYTLTISGTGDMGDYSTADAPWETLSDEIKSIVIEKGVATISAGAFDDLTALESVDMADSITAIGEGAFPATNFTMNAWMNHPAGEYAKANDNVALVLKELRILSIGNSHTDDYTQWFATGILTDLETNMDTDIVHERVTRGGRQINRTNNGGGEYGTHTLGITDSNHEKYADYQAALAKTWDVVIFQDYRESVIYGADFAEDLLDFTALLREKAPGAQLVWFADWVENSFDSSASYYNNSIACIQAVEADAGAPDMIIPMSTIIKNARTSYLGATMNPDGVHASYPNNNIANGDKPNTKMPLLERDNAHLSYELGRYLAGAAVMSYIVDEYEEYLSLNNGFNYYDCLETAPEYSWKGEFTDEIWTIIQEVTETSKTAPYAVTNSAYATDPFDAKYAKVTEILEAALPWSKTEAKLNEALKAATVIEEINSETGLNIAVSDIVITVEDGTYTVTVDCHYGYSYPTETAISGTVTGLIGDIDGNGKIEDVDAMRVARALAGWSGYEEYLTMDAADVNRDGNVTDVDAMILARYKAGWTGYDKYFN